MLEVPADRQLIVVTGGSLGADRINEVVSEALDTLLERAVVVHVCGRDKTRPIERAGYHQFEFVGPEWGDMLAAADLVVSRAGANAVYELLSLRKPNLLIPLSRQASRGDQIENAAYAEQQGFSRVLDEADLDAAALIAAVDEILAEVAAESGKIAGFLPPDSVSLIVGAIDRAAASTRRSR